MEKINIEKHMVKDVSRPVDTYRLFIDTDKKSVLIGTINAVLVSRFI